MGPEKERAFADDMHRLFLERCRGYGTGVQFGEVLRGVLSLVRTHRVALDANYMTLVMNVLCLEGMAVRLASRRVAPAYPYGHEPRGPHRLSPPPVGSPTPLACCFGWQAALLPGYNVLDAARPLLTTHRRLPRPVFRAALPLVCRIKRLRDEWWATRNHPPPAAMAVEA